MKISFFIIFTIVAVAAISPDKDEQINLLMKKIAELESKAAEDATIIQDLRKTVKKQQNEINSFKNAKNVVQRGGGYFDKIKRFISGEDDMLIASLDSEIDHLKDKVGQLEHDLGECDVEYGALKMDFEKKNKVIEIYQKKVDELNQRYQLCDQQLIRYKDRAERLKVSEAKVDELEQEIENIKTQHSWNKIYDFIADIIVMYLQS